MTNHIGAITRIKRFYNRNFTSIWACSLLIFPQLFWWQLQHNPAIVPREKRRRYIGPVPVLYLDELEFFKKSKEPTAAAATTKSSTNE